MSHTLAEPESTDGFTLNAQAAGAAIDPGTLSSVLDPQECLRARQTIESFPAYAPTPLRSLDGISRNLGLAQIFYKDESSRLGLSSFKALGAPYALVRLLSERLGHEASPRDLISGACREHLEGVTVSTATDGNHGLALAWAAQSCGCSCRIYLHANVSAAREEAIQRHGATILRTPGNYDDSVHQCAQDAARSGYTVISDTSYEGYTTIPAWVVQGYTVLCAEISDAMAAPPTHVFVQAGVGALAAAVTGYLSRRWVAPRPCFVVVEPVAAPCVFESIQRGAITTVPGEHATIMDGLACGEPSPSAWEIVSRIARAALTISEEDARAAMDALAKGTPPDGPISAGASGAAGLAGLMRACREPAIREALGLDSESRVLVIGTERGPQLSDER